MKLQKEWEQRLKLIAEGNKLTAEGYKLQAEGDKLCAEGGKLYAKGIKLWGEGNKLWAESDKLYAKGNKLWAEAVLKAYGNIKLEWENWNEKYLSSECHLGNGEVYGFEEEK